MWSIFETRSILFHSRNICLNRYICGIRNSPSNANSIFCCKTHHKGRIIGRRLWKEPIVPQKRSVSRTLDKKHQTKPPAFTESAGPAAPSLERVHVASFLQHRPHFFRRHRSRHRAPFTAKKIARRRESYGGIRVSPWL